MHPFNVFTHSAWLRMSETACGRFAGLRGMPATTESVMGTALIRINTANSTAKKNICSESTPLKLIKSSEKCINALFVMHFF